MLEKDFENLCEIFKLKKEIKDLNVLFRKAQKTIATFPRKSYKWEKETTFVKYYAKCIQVLENKIMELCKP